MNKVPDSDEVDIIENHIESHPAHLREIIQELQHVSKAIMPGAYEFIYHGAINYKLYESPGTWICYIAAQSNYVNLGFYFGTNLTDPKKLLEGTGKRMRHVKVRTVAAAGTHELADLIRQAWDNASNSIVI